VEKQQWTLEINISGASLHIKIRARERALFGWREAVLIGAD
jgi:hypothetical protein